MLFNSAAYFAFFTLVAVGYFALPHRFRWALLLAASYFFYMSWNAAYIALIVASTAVDYCVGLGMSRVQRRRQKLLLLLTSLSANLGLLFTFKYWDFANDTISLLLSEFGLVWHLPDLHVLLPVGISFYTFQTLSYTIDIYRGTLEPERHLGRFALYVAFFPQLVAGPIERAGRLLPQLRERIEFDWDRISSGLQLILWGLFKKVVIADRLALYVDAVYGNVHENNASSLTVATWLFAFQIYCDFSAYSDIALGSAKVLGINLMENFRRPYFSLTMGEFWRRWHISLSTWLRDYLYIPLGGNLKGLSRTYLNLMTTMLLGGLWHGASWNFVIWGAFHGVLLAASRATLAGRNRLYARLGVPAVVRDAWRMFLTFQLVCIGWIFFRAATLADSTEILARMLGLHGGWGMPFMPPNRLAHAAFGLVVLLLVQIFQERRGPVRSWLAAKPLALRWAALYLLALSIIGLGVEDGAQFIYFQF